MGWAANYNSIRGLLLVASREPGDSSRSYAVTLVVLPLIPALMTLVSVYPIMQYFTVTLLEVVLSLQGLNLHSLPKVTYY